ncbi:MAG: hypothetical protein AAFV25_16035, partial [Bacteroidota bacterium]
MGIFNRLFGSTSSKDSQPRIRFGRYTDSYKGDEQYDFWDASLEHFEEDNYLKAYDCFLRYLRDEKEDNVRWEERDGVIHFEIYQGSKKIIGTADHLKISAEARIAHVENPDTDFMRRLLEHNFRLKHSRFALDGDNNITIRFDSFTLDGSPYKLYFALKELATSADKQDDLLLDEFRGLQAVDTEHLRPLSESEKALKFDFLTQQIGQTLSLLDRNEPPMAQYPGGYAYLLLDLIYKLDYILRPEGFTMETLERSHRQYFANDHAPIREKIDQLRQELQALLDRDRSDFFREMYEVKSTFGITNPVAHDRVVSFIDGELHNMDWYVEHQYFDIAAAIPGYIVGYCMFNYAVPCPDRDLFQLYYRIVESDFFKRLGFGNVLYKTNSGGFDKRGIRREIRQIAEKNQARYPDFQPDVGLLKYNSLVDFARSFLLMVRELNL